MRNGWTGGQYSLVRMLFGGYLLVHCAALIPWAREVFVDVLPRDASPLLHLFPNVLAVADIAVPLLVVACGAAICLMIGWHDRIAALLLWYVLACLFGRNPLISNPSLPFAGWLLLVHAALPPAPFLALSARNRVDPRGASVMPPPLYAAIWIVMSLAYSYSGWTKLMSPSWVDGTALLRVLANPLARPSMLRDAALLTPEPLLAAATWGALVLELAFAPLALFRRARPWLWTAMLLMHLGLMVMIDFADLSLMMVILHLFTFDPAWVRAGAPQTTDTVLYDGHCGLCHRSVRFLLAEDPGVQSFIFRPLDPSHGALKSVVVETSSGETFRKSRAVVHLLHRLGGLWRLLAVLFSVVPSRIADAMYDFVAILRYRVFGRTTDACPIVPVELRSRFIE
jgi:predicted DCC family thiol-disulfide oxidoreductase YuxK